MSSILTLVFNQMKSKWKVPNLLNTKISEILYDRSVLITPNMIGKTIQIHKGNGVFQLLISTEHVGHKAGEFALTKVSGVFKHSKKKGR